MPVGTQSYTLPCCSGRGRDLQHLWLKVDFLLPVCPSFPGPEPSGVLWETKVFRFGNLLKVTPITFLLSISNSTSLAFVFH